MSREITQEWHSKKFLEQAEKELVGKESFEMEWHITKPTMIATINYVRAKGYKCEWIEKREDLFMIKISKK